MINLRTIVISDVHGMLELFKKALKDIEYSPDKDKLILLGDYIDRGPASASVVDYIIELQRNNRDNVIALRGNHEQMAIDALKDGSAESFTHSMYLWLSNGARDTVDSYARSGRTPSVHLGWFKSLPLTYEDKNFFYCHAGVDPYTSLDEQKEEDLLWIREDFFLSKKKLQKRVVFGHTPLAKGHAIFKNGAIGIDGGAVFKNRITVFEIKEDERNFQRTFYSCEPDSFERVFENWVGEYES